MRPKRVLINGGAITLMALCLLLHSARASSLSDQCLVDLQVIPGFLLENDTGAKDELAQWGQAHFDAALARARADASQAKDPESCNKTLNAYLKAWRKGHLRVAEIAKTDGARPAVASSSPPTMTELSSRTVLLTLHSFGPDVSEPLAALVSREHQALSTHSNWIIDVRGNDGGSDSVYYPLLAWLMPDEREDVGDELLATPANIEATERVCAIYAPGNKECQASVEDAVRRMRTVASGSYVAQHDGPAVRYLRVKTLEAHRPTRVAVLVDSGCASSCEEFLLAVRQSFNVKLLGRHSHGSLDYSNLRPYDLPSGVRRLWYATTRSDRLPGLPVDVAGVQPDILLPEIADEQSREGEVRTAQRWLEDGSLAAQGQSSADTSRGNTLFDSQCALCHGPGGQGGQGPALGGVVGRKVASADFSYTAALRSRSWTWDAVSLERFLANPQEEVPGSSMSASVASAQDRADIVEYLTTLKATSGAGTSSAIVASTALSGWRQDAPGHVYRFSAANLPAPSPESSASNAPQIVARPDGAWPNVPAGFTVKLFAEDLQAPRVLRTAPNGDVFVAETSAGRIRVLRSEGGEAHSSESFVFASGLAQPFGLAFYPAGEHPRWLYVAETNRVIRLAYRPGATAAVGQPQVIIKRISPTSAGHSNRDLAVSPDGHWMFIGVGSSSNVADGMSKKSVGEAHSFGRQHGLGAAWDGETDRAEVRAFTPEGKKVHAFATGLRNCSGITVQRASRAVWCSTNERDRLGDDLVPDYVTRVKSGAFYGWPWWYIGDHEDPRLAGERPDLRGKVTVPDVLLQSHSAPLGISFAEGAKLPEAWRGSAFVAAHGSWNRAERTGPKLIRIIVDSSGRPTGAYEDVMTGFVLDNQHVWGRPVGITVAKDGSLLISDDAGGVIWQLAYQ